MAQVPLNDLSRVDPLIQEQVLGDIGEILRSGSFLKGRFTQALESHLSHMFGNSSITCVANGTDALFIALSALGVGPGTRVATVANAGGYTTGATLRLGALPVFIDVNPNTAQMSASALRTQLQSDQQVAVVVVTHLYGLIGEIAEIAKVCQEFDIPLVEDCAQSFGASFEGKLAGTFGDAATFSFYPTKNLGAFGDAGAIATRDLVVTQKVQYGWGTRYSVELSNGVNSRIDEMQAAALVRQLPLIQRNNDIRRDIVHKYSQALTSTRKIIMHDDERFVGHLAIMLTDSRESDQSQLASLGIATGIHYPIADYKQPVWRETLGNVQLPNTDKLQQQILTLPCFPSMTSSEINQVVAAIAQLD